MSTLRITVGASMDRSFESVLNTMVTATQRAQKRVATEQAKAAKSSDQVGIVLAKSMKKGASEAEAAYSKLVASIEGKGSKMMAPATRAIVQHSKETQSAFKGTMAAFDQTARHIEAGLRKQENQQRSRDREALKSTAARFLKEGTGLAGGALKVAGKMALGGAKAFASGAGVDMSLSSIVGKNADLQEQAINLSNAAYMPGDKGANGKRKDPNDLIATVRQASLATGTDSGEAMAGLSAFVAKTGDLNTGIAALQKMAALAKATGSSLKDTMDAAADISIGLEDGADKGERLDMTMRLVASQTKIGSVEMADFAKRMPKIAAAAGQIEGDFQGNISKLSALAQISKRSGGASSGAEAATSIAGLINTLKTPARVAKFGAAKVNVFGEGGKIRDPVEVIIDSLKKTKGDPMAMKKLFANVQGERAVTGLANTFRGAGGGEAGEEAVRAALAEFTKELLTADEVQKSLNETLKSQKSQSQNFNTEMQKVVDELGSVLLPALAAIAPTIVGITKMLSGWISEKFVDKADREVKKNFPEIEEVEKVTDTVRTGIKKGALPMSAVAQIDEALAKAKARQKILREDHLREKEADSPKDWITHRDKKGNPAAGTFGDGYKSEDIAKRASAYENMNSRLEDSINQLTGQQKIVVDNLISEKDAVVRVHLVADETKKVDPPKPSPLGGRQAIASGC